VRIADFLYVSLEIMSIFKPTELITLAQKEWLACCRTKSIQEVWDKYCLDFDATERIASTPNSLATLKKRAQRHRYRAAVASARTRLLSMVPPLLKDEMLVTYLRRLQNPIPADSAVEESTRSESQTNELLVKESTSTPTEESIPNQEVVDMAVDDDGDSKTSDFIEIQGEHLEVSKLHVPEALSSRYRANVIITRKR